MTSARRILLFAWAVLCLQAAIPVWMGTRILNRPKTLRQMPYPTQVPTTGPYTNVELSLAENQLRAFLTTQPSTTRPFTDDQVQAIAENTRELERVRQMVWQERREKLADQAAMRRPIGVLLIALGAGLILLWTYLAWRLWHSPRFAPRNLQE